MRYLLAGLVVVLPMVLPWASDHAFDRETLETALTLAGLDRANLPITLATVAPSSASHGIEAWTSYDADGTGEQIFVYVRGEMFLCARWPFGMRQCRIRLASALIHEAWHFELGRNERDAYEAQIAFLVRNGAATEHVKAVRLARNRVLAEERRAIAEGGHDPGRAPSLDESHSTKAP
jgi:hypothetical protein